MKIKRILGFSLLMLLWGSNAQAVSITIYCIYLDTDKPTSSFMMFNKTASDEQCQLDIIHKAFDASGTMSDIAEDVIPDNSAEPWIRYSPRSFHVEAGAPQTVRFTLRRKPNMEAAEYRSYMKIFCEEVTEGEQESDQLITVKARFVQNVPIIVRTGELNASLSFSDINVTGGEVTFNVNRQGNRSVYGQLQLIDTRNDEVVSSRKNISVYTESQTVKYDLANKNIPAEYLMIKFIEDERYGGTLLVETPAING
jgi:hypothetical protein